MMMEVSAVGQGFSGGCPLPPASAADRGELAAAGSEEPARNRSNTWPSGPFDATCFSTDDRDRAIGQPAKVVAEIVHSAPGFVKPTGSRKNPWGGLSYAELITMAIESSPEKRMTLSELYDWMVKNVPYFNDKGDSFSSAGWKNSIRHNLSLHSRFIRVINETTGKSSWWMVNHDMKPGLTSRRRAVSMDTKVFERKRGRVRKKLEEMRTMGGGSGGGGGGSEVDSTTGSPPSSKYACTGLLHCPVTSSSWPPHQDMRKHHSIHTSLEPTMEETLPPASGWTDLNGMCDHQMTLGPYGTDQPKPVSESLAEVLAGNLNVCESQSVRGIDYHLFDRSMITTTSTTTTTGSWPESTNYGCLANLDMSQVFCGPMEERLSANQFSALIHPVKMGTESGRPDAFFAGQHGFGRAIHQAVMGSKWLDDSIAGPVSYHLDSASRLPKKPHQVEEANLKQLRQGPGPGGEPRWISSPVAGSCSPVRSSSSIQRSDSLPLSATTQMTYSAQSPLALISRNPYLAYDGSTDSEIGRNPCLQYSGDLDPSHPLLYPQKFYQDDSYYPQSSVPFPWTTGQTTSCGLQSTAERTVSGHAFQPPHPRDHHHSQKTDSLSSFRMHGGLLPPSEAAFPTFCSK